MTVLRTDLTRLFLLDEDPNSYALDPIYINCVEVDGVSQSAGDMTVTYEPDPENPGEFIEFGAFRTTKERAAASLIMRATIDQETVLAERQRSKCSFDLHLNVGVCLNPASIDQFSRKEIWEGVDLTNFQTSKLSAFNSEGIELVTETHGISIKNRYAIFNPKYSGFYALTCTDFGTNAGALIVPPARCCGSTPGQIAFIGSASGNGMIGLTTNFGRDWECLDTEGNQKMVGGAMWRKWLVFAGHNGYIYLINWSSKNFSDRLRCSAPALIGFFSDSVTGIGLTADRKLYTLRNETGFEIYPAYTHSADFLNIGDAKRNGGFAILDNANRVVYSANGNNWSYSTAFADPATVTPYGVAIRGPGQWLVSASDALYYTNDYGVTWTTGPGLPYPGPLFSATKHVLFSAGYDQTTGLVRIFRTTDGNATWGEEPNLAGAGLVNESIQPVKICCAPENPNIVWMAGFNPSGSCAVFGRP